MTLIMNIKGKLSSDKAATIITAICDKYNLSIDEATAMFYKSETAALIDEGVADLHCRSPRYLAQCIWDEYNEDK